MVKKVIIRIWFICITSVLLNILYQVFFTNEKYRRLPPYFVPDMELPIFFIITFVLGFIFDKYLMKSNGIWALIFALFVAIIFYSSATAVENKYAYLYEHYYKTTSYENLTHLKEYDEKRDNRFTLGKALKNIGVKVTSIEAGYTDKGHLVSSPDAYQKKLYYVYDDLYIIFDWDERKITAQTDKEKMLQLLYERYEQINEDMHSDTLYAPHTIALVNEEYKLLKDFLIVPTKEDTYIFIQTQ